MNNKTIYIGVAITLVLATTVFFVVKRSVKKREEEAMQEELEEVNVTPVLSPAPAPTLKAGWKSTTTNVNLRSDASASSTLLATVPKDTVLEVKSTSGNWGKVTFNGKTGWISGTYLKNAIAPPPAPVLTPEYERATKLFKKGKTATALVDFTAKAIKIDSAGAIQIVGQSDIPFKKGKAVGIVDGVTKNGNVIFTAKGGENAPFSSSPTLQFWVPNSRLTVY